MAFGTFNELWPNATIPYVIDEADFPDDSPDRIEIDAAIREWNDNTVIELVGRRSEQDFIVFKDTGTVCASAVGRAGEGGQSVTCDLEGGGFNRGSLMHEIGHAVGFHHEQQRPDRAGFVDVGSDVDAVNCAQLAGGRLLTDYDCGSIMHYPRSACGGITPVASGCLDLGQVDRLSGRDVWGASLLYQAPTRTVVVWQDAAVAAGSPQVHTSGFVDTGARGLGPIPVNRRSGGVHRDPQVGMSRSGNMVIVWADDSDGNGLFQVAMRGFAANGHQHISERTVNKNAAGQQVTPDVAVDEVGRIVVVWADDTDGNGLFQIKARGFKGGNERFSQRTVNRVARGQHTAPRVAIAPNGFFVVVWEDDTDLNGFTNLHMRGFHADGRERWSERRVHVSTSGQQRRPRIAMGPLGDFVVVWEDDRDSNGSFRIRMRAFTADGNEKFAERRVHAHAFGQYLEPDVAVDDVFRPVVVWSEDRDQNGEFQIRCRGFESDGRVRLAERTVNTDEEGQQRRAVIAMEANGRFVVAWWTGQTEQSSFAASRTTAKSASPRRASPPPSRAAVGTGRASPRLRCQWEMSSTRSDPGRALGPRDAWFTREGH